MKSKLVALLSVFLFILLSVCIAQKSTKNSSLFTQANVSKWEYIINDKTVSPSRVFVMNDGLLQITGVSTGYLRTKKTYTNYELNLEWRWTKKFGNSGVLVHIQQKDSIWPVCYQVQQKADAAGDIICMNGLWAKECADSVKFTVKKLLPSNEKPLGEWNSMRIICNKNTLKVYVNGILQNNLTGLTARKGFIGFQNEGTPLEFRKLTVVSK
ncbi:MAG TPA: DUF1080 domain-containing protein [Paludibacter sp.]|nr:DUF1080 domain-containing protein [Paludibacter sp.]